MSRGMKLVLAMFGLALFAGVASSIAGTGTPAPATEPPSSGDSAAEAAKVAFLAYMKGQPEIKDATFSEANWLYLGVLNDGTDWTSYAVQTCGLLRGRGLRDVFAVKMIDIVKLGGGQGFVEITKAVCGGA